MFFRLSCTCFVHSICLAPSSTKFAHKFQTLSCLLCAFCFTPAYAKHVADTLIITLCILSRSFLCKVCSHVSDALMLAMHYSVLFLPMQSLHMSFRRSYTGILQLIFSFPHRFHTNALICSMQIALCFPHCMITAFTHLLLYRYSSFILQAYLSWRHRYCQRPRKEQ